MKSAVIVFPGSNCDRDAVVALKNVTGKEPALVWHGEADLPDADLIVLPGGFSYGDYLRSGAIAGRSPIVNAVIKAAEAGRNVLGICNGFQILCETGLLPGVLAPNTGLNFVCEWSTLRVTNNQTPFTSQFEKDAYVSFPVAHHDGAFRALGDDLRAIEDEGRVAFRYVANPNGSTNDIAGVLNRGGNVLGLMPHPERALSPLLGGDDGVRFFSGITNSLNAA
ncbi:MAG: phosphoribosylformylglycinamidine synthase subunit PurQ [Pseudomonadota bacterium]